MASSTNKNDMQPVRNRSYIGKDFNSFRSELTTYAQQYYPDQIKDFSEMSLGGLLIDLNAYIGDVMSFYLDHQFSELDPNTAVESKNIERMLNTAGVKISGTSPATVNQTFYILVPDVNGEPRKDCLPIIQQGSLFESTTGILFEVIKDIDFNELDTNGNYIATVQPYVSNNITSYIMSRTGYCLSGHEETEMFNIGDFSPFRQITLSNRDISEIVSVYDSLGNTYYEVSALTEDVVYKNLPNTNLDSDIVSDIMTVIPAPYRFITEMSLYDRMTTLTFGGGTASSFVNNAIPDPSEFAIPMRYSRTFPLKSLDPGMLLQTSTLGISGQNCSITVIYRYGGGLSHNVGPNSIQDINSLKVIFPNNPPSTVARPVRDSLETNNIEQAKGGDDAPSITSLKQLIPSARNSQQRLASKQDLLARIYTMPSNFGRVFRAAVVPNQNNPLSVQLHIISRDLNSSLVTSPDNLKLNLRMYLNPYRMISDAIEILDMRVINLQIYFEVFVDPLLNQKLVLASCIKSLQNYFDITNWTADQPINISEIWKLLLSIQGVLAVSDVNIIPMTGIVNGLEYSNDTFDIASYTTKGLILTPQQGGSIFEVRYPSTDIIGKAV